MKSLLIGGSLALLSLTTWAQEPYLSKTFRGGTYQQLAVTSSGGKIKVTGTPEKEVQVDVYITGSNANAPLPLAEINRRLENYTLEIRQEGTQIICLAKRLPSSDLSWREQLNFMFDVKTPYQINTQLKTSGGAIVLKDTEGKADLQSSGGSLTVQGVKGRIQGKTSGGAIYAENLRESIDLSTSGGSIHAKNLSGTIQLASSGGALILEEIRGQISAETSGGSITADLRAISGPVLLKTSAGSVTVTLPKQTGLDLDVRGMRIQSSLSGPFDGRQDNKQMIGAWRGGGFPVKISTAAGAIRLN